MRERGQSHPGPHAPDHPMTSHEIGAASPCTPGRSEPCAATPSSDGSSIALRSQERGPKIRRLVGRDAHGRLRMRTRRRGEVLEAGCEERRREEDRGCTTSCRDATRTARGGFERFVFIPFHSRRALSHLHRVGLRTRDRRLRGGLLRRLFLRGGLKKSVTRRARASARARPPSVPVPSPSSRPSVSVPLFSLPVRRRRLLLHGPHVIV